MASPALDIRLFHYALASAQHGSFRRAAAALNLQQSTMSRGVRILEHRVGAALFERSHAGIRPTPAGERFLEEAALGFDHLERATQRIRAAQRGEAGEITVAASVPFALLGAAFERLRVQHRAGPDRRSPLFCDVNHREVRRVESRRALWPGGLKA